MLSRWVVQEDALILNTNNWQLLNRCGKKNLDRQARGDWNPMSVKYCGIFPGKERFHLPSP